MKTNNSALENELAKNKNVMEAMEIELSVAKSKFANEILSEAPNVHYGVPVRRKDERKGWFNNIIKRLSIVFCGT